MIGLIIEKMTFSHIEEIAKLERTCFSTPWSEEGLKSELDNNFARFFVAFSGDKIAGYIGSHNVLGEVYITNVAVFPDFRRKGVGKELVEFLINQMKTEKAEFITLEVRESNLNAISLYEKCGFQNVGERKDFYEKPREDAILMTCFLGDNLCKFSELKVLAMKLRLQLLKMAEKCFRMLLLLRLRNIKYTAELCLKLLQEGTLKQYVG